MNPANVVYPARYLCGANSLPVWVFGKQRESGSGFVCQNYNCPDSQPFFADASVLSPWVEPDSIFNKDSQEIIKLVRDELFSISQNRVPLYGNVPDLTTRLHNLACKLDAVSK